MTITYTDDIGVGISFLFGLKQGDTFFILAAL